MSELKTQPNDASVDEFVDAVEHPKRRADAQVILALMKKVTREKPVMWGGSIIGFGRLTYQYANGKTGEWMRIGFSPRKANISLYIMNGFAEYQSLLSQLGKHKTGKSCLYINKLEDIDLEVLQLLLHHSYHHAEFGGGC